MRFTILPFWVVFMVGLTQMPALHIFKICARNHGTEQVDPWRTKVAHVPVMQRLVALTERVKDWLGELADAPMAQRLLSEIGAVGNLKQAIQTEIESRAAVTKAKREGRDLMALTARTPEQDARLTAVFSELTALENAHEGIETQLAQARRLQEDERRSPTAERVEVGEDRAGLAPWGRQVAADAPAYLRAEARHGALGAFALAVRAAYSGGGTDPRLMAAATGSGTQIDSNMGFAVPMEVAPGIEREMYETGEILSRVDARTISVGNSIAYNIVDETSRADGSRGGGVLGYWVDEGTAPTASNTKLARVELKLRKVGAFGVMTDELLSDAVGLGGELESAFAEELIFQVENKIVSGNGANAPLGILNAPALVSITKETNQTAATIVADNITKMWARMTPRGRKNAVWLANSEIITALAGLVQPIGTAGIRYPYASVQDGGTILLWGRPVIFVEYASALGTVGDLILVDLKKYRLIRKGGVEQASSMHVYFSTGEQAFRAFYRVDGQLMPRAAITPFKGSATLSPAVVLATRA